MTHAFNQKHLWVKNRQLQGVLVHARRPRRRGPELRRQRHVRALPARRRPVHGFHRPLDAHRPQLFGNAVVAAAGHAARVPGKRAAVQARRRLLQEPVPDLNGPAARDRAGRDRAGGNANDAVANPTVQGAVPRASGTERAKRLAGQGAVGPEPGLGGPEQGATRPARASRRSPMRSPRAEPVRHVRARGASREERDPQARRDFTAVIVLILIALSWAATSCPSSASTCPGGCRSWARTSSRSRREFSTAQAVTPGQGQTVDIAGVTVGEISNVRAQERPRAGDHEHPPEVRARLPGRDHAAAAQDRPEGHGHRARPGQPGAGKAQERRHDPGHQTLPDVNPDEILASLDADTRATCGCCSAAGPGPARQPAPHLREHASSRFEPTGRDIAKITTPLKERRANIRRIVHNFQLLADALGDKDDQLDPARRLHRRRLSRLRQRGREHPGHAARSSRRR